jgi:hypothetical protein
MNASELAHWLFSKESLGIVSTDALEDVGNLFVLEVTYRTPRYEVSDRQHLLPVFVRDEHDEEYWEILAVRVRFRIRITPVCIFHSIAEDNSRASRSGMADQLCWEVPL